MKHDTLDLQSKFIGGAGTASALFNLMYEADAGNGVDSLPKGTVLSACAAGEAAVKEMKAAFEELLSLYLGRVQGTHGETEAEAA